VSLCLIAGSVWLLARPELRLPPLAWGLAILGALLIVLSFAVDFRYALARTDPPRFRWELFGAGLIVAIGGIALRRELTRS